MKIKFKTIPSGKVNVTAPALQARQKLNTDYIMSLTNQNLLRSFYLEAGLWSYSGDGGTTTETSTVSDSPEHWHWGWEAPTCELRGHIMGHWLSAAARIYARSGDAMVKAKADTIVAELARCQEAMGGRWLAAFSESAMHRLTKGKWVWAPHYTIHKLLMGLHEMHTLADNAQALQIMTGIASWFHAWTGTLSQEQMDEVLDMETGGMLEAWSDLYAVTGDATHRELIYRYDRRRFFDRLLAGEDVLTNKHANTQIPEILGAARAWEVTGDERFRHIVEAFWRCAVTERGSVATGAADDGELWMPPQDMAERLGVGQEHCCNYNMMRLAHVLTRWTGEAQYADYWERRFWNGAMAQQSGQDGMVSYFLGVAPGSRKKWGTRTRHFWCCHGTLMQAHAGYDEQICLKDEAGLVVSQWLPADVELETKTGTGVKLSLQQDGQHGVQPADGWSVRGMHQITKLDIPAIPAHRPDRKVYTLQLTVSQAAEFDLRLRIPWWVAGTPSVSIDGEAVEAAVIDSFIHLHRHWEQTHELRIELPKRLSMERLPGSEARYALLDGPLVLVGLTEEDRTLYGDPDEPNVLFIPDRERHHSWWRTGSYRTRGQAVGLRFIPLMDVVDQPYGVYFRVEPRPS
ncbi:beta-L-arabinofuranosidase domain-containing protein [Paenibacillus daejeonensis]|uniref:beta-L-arabinofuranosidase domain-containing protein n=1 Tax=Paenibacillus daejeonensis TaxID=135193 RepID=UPI00036FA033|nr:beta-L-arabinofuranosidase domain-containing protein [Paenibacillus daejeonensis]